MRPRDMDQAPLLLFWETTRACDLACAHCRACAQPERDPRELSTQEGRRLLENAAEMGVGLVVLTGGDPAKRPDLPELVAYGHSLGLRMALTPSATPLVTTSWLEELRDAGLARIAISIDGSQAHTHDAFRAVEGTYARSMSILWSARGLGLTTQVNTTVSALNVDELPALARTLTELDIELWSVFFVVPTGRADSSLLLDADETERVLEWLADVLPQVPYDIKTTAAPHFRRVLLRRKHHRADIVGLRDGIGRAPAASTTDAASRSSHTSATSTLAVSCPSDAATSAMKAWPERTGPTPPSSRCATPGPCWASTAAASSARSVGVRGRGPSPCMATCSRRSRSATTSPETSSPARSRERRACHRDRRGHHRPRDRVALARARR